MSMHHTCAVPVKARIKELPSPGTGIADTWLLPFGCWELNTDLLEEQSMFLRAKTPLLQLLVTLFFSDPVSFIRVACMSVSERL